MTKPYDCIIIGSGPAGLSATISARRAGLAVLLLEKDIVGGSPAVMTKIENYPGIEKIDGWSFTRIMEKQAKSLEADIRESEEVVAVNLETDRTKTVTTANGRKYRTGTVIVASGGEPKKLFVEGEERLARKGVHYCAQCAGPAYRDATVAICGNGLLALTAADYLLQLASKVVFITEENQLRGDAILATRLISDNRFQMLPETRVREIGGTSQVERLVLESLATGAGRELTVDGLFVYQGLAPRAAFLSADKDPAGYLRVDEKLETSMPGVFAAGSVVRPEPEIVIAAGDGARAALAAATWFEASLSTVSD